MAKFKDDVVQFERETKRKKEINNLQVNSQ